jgi:ketosteroid isomerase-like protein
MSDTLQDVSTTYSDYCFAIDSDDAAGVAACFMPDGVFEISGRGGFVGREAIEEVIAATIADRPRHHFLNLGIVEDGPEVVRSRAYFLLMQRETGATDAYGEYEDELHRFEGRLRFAHRKVHFRWVSPAYEARGNASVADSDA